MRTLFYAFKNTVFALGFVLAAQAVQAQTVAVTDNGPGSSFPEGNSGTASAVRTFTIARTSGSGTTVVSFSLSGFATLTEDYTITGTGVNSGAGTVTLNNANPTRTLSINIKGDTTYELNDNETIGLTFSVSATNGFVVSGNLVTTTTITGSQDTSPTVTVNLANATEGTGTMSGSVILSNRSYLPVTVDLETFDGTAISVAAPPFPADYNALPSTVITVPAGSLQTAFTVTLNNDPIDEPNETLSATISNPINASLGSPSTDPGSILDDDAPPTVSIADQDLDEGSGTMTFFMTLSQISAKTISVSAGTAPDAAGPDPAVAPGDYSNTPATTTVTFSPGVDSQTYQVSLPDDSVFEADETFLVNLTNPNANVTLGDSQALGLIHNDDQLAPGALVISEFRLRGPNNGGPAANDEFIELANTTNHSITVRAVDGSGGISVANEYGETLFVIPNLFYPNSVVIPRGGHYLAANTLFSAPNYSLNDYGGTGAGVPDATMLTEIDDDLGLALFATDNPANYTAGFRVDSVGFTSTADPLYVEGGGLAPVGAGDPPAQYSFVRKSAYGAAGALLDTGSNASDFVLVAVDASIYGATTAVLGGPSPENLTAETSRANTELQLALCDPSVGQNSGANYLFTPATASVNKSVELRRTFTNLTTGSFGAIRFKATSLSGLNNNSGGTEADFRPATSSAFAGVCSAQALTLEDPPGYLTSGLPGQLSGSGTMGGLNSTLRTAAVPLTPASVLGVNFKLYYTTAGKPGYFWLTSQTKP